MREGRDARGVKAVSYTHLDVYKRQEKSLGHVAGDFFQRVPPEAQGCADAHDHQRGAGDQAGGVPAGQVKRNHGDDVRRERRRRQNGRRPGRAV